MRRVANVSRLYLSSSPTHTPKYGHVWPPLHSVQSKVESFELVSLGFSVAGTQFPSALLRTKPSPETPKLNPEERLGDPRYPLGTSGVSGARLRV